MIKTYNPQSSHVSSSIGAWVNYMGASEEAYTRTRFQIYNDFPGAVIVDGNDDFTAKEFTRPQLFVQQLNIQPLAYYHSGTSGITKSGVVLSAEDYQKLVEEFPKKYGRELNSVGAITVYSS